MTDPCDFTRFFPPGLAILPLRAFLRPLSSQTKHPAQKGGTHKTVTATAAQAAVAILVFDPVM